MASSAEQVIGSRPKRSSAREALWRMRRRRKYLIDAQAQWRITRLFLFVLGSAASLGAGNYHVASEMLAAQPEDELEVMLSLVYIGGMCAISIALLVLLCIFLSHRIAGPARKISETLASMAEGDLSKRITLRDTDLLTELAAAINSTNARLRESLGEVEREVRRAQLSLTQDPELARASLDRSVKLLGGFQLSTGKEADPRAAASGMYTTTGKHKIS